MYTKKNRIFATLGAVAICISSAHAQEVMGKEKKNS